MIDLDLRIALHRDADLVGEPSPDLLDQLAVRRDRQRRQRAGMFAAALGVVVIAAAVPVGSSFLTQSDSGPAIEITDPAPSTTREAPIPAPAPSPNGDPLGTVVEPPPVPEGAAPSVTQQARVVSPEELLYFYAPSRNIACEMAQDHATCQIMKRNFERPTKPSDCEWDYGESFGVEGEARAEWLCMSDTVFGARRLRTRLRRAHQQRPRDVRERHVRNDLFHLQRLPRIRVVPGRIPPVLTTEGSFEPTCNAG